MGWTVSELPTARLGKMSGSCYSWGSLGNASCAATARLGIKLWPAWKCTHNWECNHSEAGNETMSRLGVESQPGWE